MGRRIRWLGLVLVVCFLAVVAQLVNIQVRDATQLDANSANPRNIDLDNYRGEIFAAGGTTVLAKSVPVTDRKAGQPEYYRTYPDGTLYAGIVGYDSWYRGTAGVENVYNTQLSLHAQPIETWSQLLSPPPKEADDVTLTVDPTLQETAWQALTANDKSTHKDGAVVAIDVKTGSILAMVSNPTYNPNLLSQPTVTAEEAAAKQVYTTKDAEGLVAGEPVATDARFAPGSTYKVVTTSAVYNLRPTLSNFTWGPGKCTNKGTIPGTDITICNDADTLNHADACGGTIRQMLPQSCDPGYVMLGLRVGATAMYKQSEDFGVNTAPPIDLTRTAVAASHFPTAGSFVTGTGTLGQGGLALAAFGQGTDSLTPLENALISAGVADTGTIMTPHVMSQIRNAQGALVEQYKPTVWKQAMSASAAQQVKSVMHGVTTTPAGTAYGIFTTAELTGQVAAKTGTAQLGPTLGTETNDWMVAFAPVSDPTVAVAVAVPYQGKTQYGATTAGPIARTVLAAALAEQQASGSTTTTPTSSTTTTTTSSTTTTTSSVQQRATSTTATVVVPTTVVPTTPTSRTRTVTGTPAAPTVTARTVTARTVTARTARAGTTTTTVRPTGTGATASTTRAARPSITRPADLAAASRSRRPVRRPVARASP